MKIKYWLVYPERELMEKYKIIAIARGSSAEFVNGFFSYGTNISMIAEKINIRIKLF